MYCFSIFWGTTKMTWDLAGHGSDKDRTRVSRRFTTTLVGAAEIFVIQVQLKDNGDNHPCRVWKLIPVKLDPRPQPMSESVPASGSDLPPPYEGNTGNKR